MYKIFIICYLFVFYSFLLSLFLFRLLPVFQPLYKKSNVVLYYLHIPKYMLTESSILSLTYSLLRQPCC